MSTPNRETDTILEELEHDTSDGGDTTGTHHVADPALPDMIETASHEIDIGEQ